MSNIKWPLPPPSRETREAVTATARVRQRHYVIAALALAFAAGLQQVVNWRTRHVAAQLSELTDMRVTIASVDAGLTGTLTAYHVRVGDLISADAMAAKTSIASLLRGAFAADEIEVEGPQVTATFETDYEALAALVTRVAKRRATRPAVPTEGRRLRRIVMSRGELVVTSPQGHQLTMRDVELRPEAGGVRVLAGHTQAVARWRGILTRLQFARLAADLTLPSLGLTNLLAVGGEGTLAYNQQLAGVRSIALVQRGAASPVRVFARLLDQGVDRTITAAVATTRPRAIFIEGQNLPLALLAPLLPPSLGLTNASASGSATLASYEGHTRLHAKGEIKQLELHHPKVHEEILPLTLTGEIDTLFDRNTNSALINPSRVKLGALEVRVQGRIERVSTPTARATLLVDLPRVDCAEALAALPVAIRAPLDGLGLVGNLEGQLAFAADLGRPIGEGVTLTPTLAPSICQVTADPPLADVHELTGPRLHTFPTGSQREVGPGTPGWTPLASLPSHVAGAFTSAEDARYWQHHGFDIVQLGRSLEINWRDRALLRGGSTISQQLIKNAFLSHKRHLGRKLQELVLTWRLEQVLTKAQILERYLNILELGPDVYGVDAAARFWFGIPGKRLSPKQVALLAAMTSEPRSMTRRLRRQQGIDPTSQVRIDVVLRAMRRDGVISQTEYTAAVSAPLALSPSALAVAD